MKRICMILPSFTARGGIASVARGYQGSALEEKYQMHYIETYCDGGKGAKLWKAVSAYAAFLKELLFCKPYLIHIHSSFGASFYRKLPFVWLASWLHIPVVNHIHGSEFSRFFREAPAWEKKIKRKTFSMCDAVVVLTEQWRQEFSEMIDVSKTAVIPNYAKLRFRSDTGKTVLFLGFLSKLKGCFDIPEIVNLVKEQIPDVRFVLAGAGEEGDVRQIKSLTEEYGVTENIVFPGWVGEKEKAQELEKAAIYFLPSYTEGMPMSILEAMGYGLPVVSSNVGGIPQLVTHGENGLLCEPGDVHAFAGAIVSLLTDEQRRGRMGQKSFDILQEKYTLEAHITRIACIYDALL